MPPAVLERPRFRPGIPPEPVSRFTVEQYYEMVKHGIIDEDDNVELLDGWVVPKMTKHRPHIYANEYLHALLPNILPAGWSVFGQNPVTIGSSVPEPDIAVARGTQEEFLKQRRDPTDSEVVLVIEIAEASLYRDKGLKKRIYAEGGVAFYWIVNLKNRRVEVYSEPTGPAKKPDYRKRQDFAPGDSVPVVLDRREVGRIAVSKLIP
ncbi:MAG TPA: Uma2 family endonuclease [Planctomycetota bacterium]|jgi:Uma2 family endonuclease